MNRELAGDIELWGEGERGDQVRDHYWSFDFYLRMRWEIARWF